MQNHAYNATTGVIAQAWITGTDDPERTRLEDLGLVVVEATYEISDLTDWRYVSGQLQPYAPSGTEALARDKSTASHAVDDLAEAQRLRYVTPGTGQAMAYQAKEAEARALASDPAPIPSNYPHLVAEIGITPHPATGQVAVDIQGVAAIILYTAEQWKSLSAAIEHIRRKAKWSIEQAADKSEIDSILGAIAWPGN